ncbi:head completion protein [Stenotrophomonas phage IME13]|uniref:Head completion protein n=1 Tax=Stenotrophomonas phage IME13 TaxID=1211280 RepID=J7I4Z0_9CAUD|nr:head closure [Stenotrophomonas phage IME13]AFQ22623.1 head completion protein [Stenotrophomonas phage IME13]
MGQNVKRPSIPVRSKTRKGMQTSPNEVYEYCESQKSNFMAEMYTWQVNTDKWKAAHALCMEKGWNF